MADTSVGPQPQELGCRDTRLREAPKAYRRANRRPRVGYRAADPSGEITSSGACAGASRRRSCPTKTPNASHRRAWTRATTTSTNSLIRNSGRHGDSGARTGPCHLLRLCLGSRSAQRTRRGTQRSPLRHRPRDRAPAGRRNAGDGVAGDPFRAVARLPLFAVTAGRHGDYRWPSPTPWRPLLSRSCHKKRRCYPPTIPLPPLFNGVISKDRTRA